MKIRTRTAATAIAAAGALGLAMLGTSSALADTGPVTAVTHASDHPDTTNISGGACVPLIANEPTWAVDNMSRQFSVTYNGGESYTVVITDHGSFAGYADPTTCQPLTSHGSIHGTYTVAVTSPTGPDPAELPAQERGSIGTLTMVSQLFGGKATSITGEDYSYSYQNGNYVQTTHSITGDVVGH